MAYGAQIGDRLIKLRFSERFGRVSQPDLERIECKRFLADYALTLGCVHASDRARAESLECHFALHPEDLETFLDQAGYPDQAAALLQDPDLAKMKNAKLLGENFPSGLYTIALKQQQQQQQEH